MRIQRAVFIIFVGFPEWKKNLGMVRVTGGAYPTRLFVFFFASSPLAVWHPPLGVLGPIEELRCLEFSSLCRSGTRLRVLIGPGVSTISRQDGRGCG